MTDQRPKQPATELLLKELNKWCKAYGLAEGNRTGEEATSLAVAVLLSVLRHMTLTYDERVNVHAVITRLSVAPENERLAETLRRGKGSCSFESALLDVS